MSNGKRVRMGVAIFLAIVALGIVLYFLFRGGPAGPVIVIEPDIPGGGSYNTVWSVETCEKGQLKHSPATKDPSYFGVPGALSSIKGAYRIGVKVKSVPEAPAVKIIMKLDSQSSPLTIDLPVANGVPKWNFGTKIVPHNGGKLVYQWSGDLYGRIEDLQYVDPSNNTQSVTLSDLEWIKIYYNPVKSCP